MYIFHFLQCVYILVALQFSHGTIVLLLTKGPLNFIIAGFIHVWALGGAGIRERQGK